MEKERKGKETNTGACRDYLNDKKDKRKRGIFIVSIELSEDESQVRDYPPWRVFVGLIQSHSFEGLFIKERRKQMNIQDYKKKI